ncbi:hypothetical protein [Amycolatopsis keratiniphila]|uniref:Uncharacterized protein n=1 Tax=Amycolatopsis keratiniphila subsp. keratiniphila TaxID=227715 RepID=A0A1W2M2R7_9PSEU|nr:hypothetical protein [Amycolatopsis keratiniphila]ONF74337.1 hypothetical protein AVR91_0203285 [Amycolatopsis keratiniphila subsp. keratiniphila]
MCPQGRRGAERDADGGVEDGPTVLATAISKNRHRRYDRDRKVGVEQTRVGTRHRGRDESAGDEAEPAAHPKE